MDNEGDMGGNIVAFPGPGAAKLDDPDKIRAAVEDRIREEAERIGGNGSSDDGGGDGIDSKFIRRCLNANELGDGEMFKRLHAGKLLFNKSADAWMIWTGHHWDIDRMDAASAMVEAVVERYLKEANKITDQLKDMDDKDGIKRLENMRVDLFKRSMALRSTRRRANCLTFAHTTANPLAIRGDEIDRQPHLFACANGVINLQSGEMLPGRPDDYLLKASPIEWKGIDEPCPMWDEFLMQIMEDDDQVVGFMRRLFGYAMVGAVKEHIIAVLEGRGRNGKGTIVEIMNHIMGKMAGPIRSEMLLDQSRNMSSAGPTPDIMALRGLRMAFASETDEGCRISAARVKWLTGNDELTGRNPHDKYEVSFKPTHTLFLLTNNKPHAPAEDFAFWQRVLLIPFSLSFVTREPEQEHERRADIHLADKLKAESSGILAWLVRGCLEWQEQKGLHPPQKVKAATADYKMDEDNIAAFVDTCCITGGIDIWSGATALYEGFEAWWKKYVSNFPMKQKKFGALMRKKFTSEKVGGVYRYYGVALTEENQDD